MFEIVAGMSIVNLYFFERIVNIAFGFAICICMYRTHDLIGPIVQFHGHVSKNMVEKGQKKRMLKLLVSLVL